MNTSFPPQISPKEIAENPTDPYRIIGILEEIRMVWADEPKKTFGQFLCLVLNNEYMSKLWSIEELSDDEFIAALQNYSDKT